MSAIGMGHTHTIVDDFYWFAKTIKNGRSPNRGKEMVFLSPKSFDVIINTPLEKKENQQHRGRTFVIRNILKMIYSLGLRFCDINPDLISRQSASRYLKVLVEKHGIEAAGQKISLNSLAMSGRMIRMSLRYNFDLFNELRKNKIPIV